ncbi:MAG TPA: efflux RND transporter permease subunit [Bacteroidales bacterium]|nr:efflux RND transporter permease subunit [Bacteroidales bacterium]
MNLPKLSVDNSSFTWTIFIFLVFIGVSALITMPRTENPPVTIPGSSILIVMPGASPTDIENLVVLPVEESLNELEHIQRITTTVRDGFVTISVEFDFETDADEKYDEVVQQFNSIRNELPDEIARVELWKWSTSDVAMFQLAMISADAPFSELDVLAERLSREIEKVPSVRKVNILALPEQEVNVELDMKKMFASHTNIDMVINSINANNANIPGGELEYGDQSLSVKTSGSYKEVEEIRNTVVNAYNGKLIYLKNIAEINYAYEDLKYYARFGGESSEGEKYRGMRSIFITVSQKEGYNVLKTSEKLMPVIREFRSKLPSNVNLEIVFDQPQKVSRRINSFMMNLLQGIVLVGLVIFVSLGFRSSIVVVLAIPLSIIIGLGFLDLSGYGLQQISIAGLIVALGLLVDNSIVMVENIDRYRSLGYKRREASYKAASEIGWPVIAATITTVLAFIPIATMPDKTGAFIKSLPITITITLLVSLLIALTLTPTITSRIYRESAATSGKLKGTKKYLRWIAENPFRSSLNYSLKHPWLILIIAVFVLTGSSLMFQFVGVSFFPKAEQPNLMIKAKLPAGSSVRMTDSIARYIEKVLDTVPEVKYYAANVGHGNPRIYYNVFPGGFDQAKADFYVELYEYEPESFQNTLIKLRSVFNDYPGAMISVKEFEQGPPYESPIQLFITGADLEILRKISSEVEEKLSSQPGVINLDNLFVKTNTELLFDINRDKASMLGVPVIEIDRTIRTVIEGMEVSSFRNHKGEEYAIVLKTNNTDSFSPDDVADIYVSSINGKQIPIKQFVDLKLKQSSSMINRYNMERTAQIISDIESDYTIDDIMQPVLQWLEKYPFPDGYDYSVGGEFEGREEAFGGMFNAIMIAILSIFAVLVFQFRSFKQPLIIFLAIPFAAIGMIWALYLTGYSFSFTAFVGLTSLIGIVVNNSIILVDYTNKLRAAGNSLTEAVKTAAETRLIPIVLTAFTTIGGLLPLTLQGGTLWAPLGWTIIGGLLVSTFLTLIVVPVFYHLLENE